MSYSGCSKNIPPAAIFLSNDKCEKADSNNVYIRPPKYFIGRLLKHFGLVACYFL